MAWSHRLQSTPRMRISSRQSRNLSFHFLFALVAVARAAPTSPAPAQPTRSGTPGGFTVVGSTGVSAQQLFLGTTKTVYVLDKTENNPMQVAGHPAWASSYSLDSHSATAMDVVTNTFCAGGSVLGNGTWLSVGGNVAVVPGGNNAPNLTQAGPPFNDVDGGRALRLLDPCDDASCQWRENPTEFMSTVRWYPTAETLDDGSIIIIGGTTLGGYVNNVTTANNPTYEYYPSRGAPATLNILTTTLPANLFPLTFLLPSNKLLIQTNWQAEIFDHIAGNEQRLPDIPGAVRTYPASGASAMLPLTPANNWTATVLFCGGTDLQPSQWVTDWNIAQYPASTSCQKITPDVSQNWVTEDDLPEARTMGNFVILPDGTLFLASGGGTGTAGYGTDAWAVGQSYADHPVMAPLLYNPQAPAGSRFSRTGLGNMTVTRLYHSSATLLPDGSVLLAGSNPNADFATNVPFPTELRTELFFPSYFNVRRPEPQGLPSQISYGGPHFDVTLSTQDLAGFPDKASKTSVVLVRTGFSTHAINMGQRMVVLENTYTTNNDGSAVLHVAQAPPNPAIMPPGPALLFVVVDGVPSIGVQVLVGNGIIGPQTVSAPDSLPGSQGPSTPYPNFGSLGRQSSARSSSRPSLRISLLVSTFVVLSFL